MRAHQREYIIICLHDDSGFEFESYSRLRDLVEKSKPKFWEFLNPGTVLIYFLSNKRNKTKVSSFIESIDHLKIESSEFKDLEIGQSKGELIAEIDWFGNVKSAPLGSAVNEAMKSAQKNI